MSHYYQVIGFVRLLGRLAYFTGIGREGANKFCAMTFGRLNIDIAIVQRHEAFDNRQAETGAFSPINV